MTVTKFSTAFMRERARLKMSRRDLADRAGVSEAVIQRWERGEAIPNVEQFRRLIGKLRRLAAFPPAWGHYGTQIVEGTFEQARSELEADLRESPRWDEQERPEPEVFGDGLRRVREENEVTQGELAELLDLTGQAISQWETENSTPVQVNLDKLYGVLPELKAGVDIGAIKRPVARDIPVPVGGPGRPPRLATVDGVIDEAKVLDAIDRASSPHEHAYEDGPERLPGRIYPNPRRCMICGEPEFPKDESEKVLKPHSHTIRCNKCESELQQQGEFWVCPTCRKIFKMLSTVGELAEAYARAKVMAAKAKQALAAAESAVVAAMMDLGTAEASAKESLELLEIAIAEEAGT